MKPLSSPIYIIYSLSYILLNVELGHSKLKTWSYDILYYYG
jgi:hypothetical protein